LPLVLEPTYYTQLEEKFIWTNALAYFVAEVNDKGRFLQHFFITDIIVK
jgi:hypothetical protein